MTPELYQRCYRCGRPVLQAARFCPHCGARVIRPETSEDAAASVWESVSWVKVLLAVFFTIGLVVCLYLCWLGITAFLILSQCFCPGQAGLAAAPAELVFLFLLIALMVFLPWLMVILRIFRGDD